MSTFSKKDHAPIESFWGTIKNELIHHKKYSNRREAIADITEYIEIFYNPRGLKRNLDIFPLLLLSRNITMKTD